MIIRLGSGSLRGIILLFLFLTTCRYAYSEDTTVFGELKRLSTNISSEGADFLTRPFTVENGNLFWAIGIAGVIGLTYTFDSDIHDNLQGRVRSRGMDTAADAGELIGNPYLHLGVAALVYGGGIVADSPEWKETGEMILEALFLADAATLLLKEGTGRGRPSVTSRKEDFRPFALKNDYDSFPSMHTASSFAIASIVSRKSDSLPVSVACYTAAAFVGFSRLYQNKHWATDLLLGAAIGELSGRVVTDFHADKKRRLVLLPGVNSQAVTMNLRYSF